MDLRELALGGGRGPQLEFTIRHWSNAWLKPPDRGQNFVTRNIQVGRRNDEDIVVTGGLKEGELVTLESPADAAKRARKKL